MTLSRNTAITASVGLASPRRMATRLRIGRHCRPYYRSITSLVGELATHIFTAFNTIRLFVTRGKP